MDEILTPYSEATIINSKLGCVCVCVQDIKP